MMNTTTNNRHGAKSPTLAWFSKNLIPILVTLSLVLHIGGGIVFYKWDELRYSVMRYDPDAVEELTEEAKERERERKKREEEQRERTELREEHAEELVNLEEDKKKREMQERIEQIQAANEELAELIEEKQLELDAQDWDGQIPPPDSTMALGDMPPPLTDRELAELLQKGSLEIESDSGSLESRLTSRQRQSNVIEKRKNVEVTARQLTSDLTRKLDAPDLQASDLLEVLPTIDKLLDTSWELAKDASGVANRSKSQIRDSQRDLDRARKSTDAKDQQQNKEIESLKNRIAQAEQTLEEDLQTSREAQQIAQKAIEMNQMALNHLIAHLAQNLNAMSANDLFELAKLLEELMAKNFAQFRAQELALIQQTSFEEALGMIHIPQQQRPDLSGQLVDPNVNTIGDLNAFRQSLGEALNHVQAMQTNAGNMLDQAKGLNQQNQQGTSMNMTAMQRAMLNAAGSERGQRQVMDMTATMGAIHWMGGQGGTQYQFDPFDNREAGGEFFKPKLTSAPSRLNSRQVLAQAMPGRKFTEDSKRKGWLYLDTWYIIGPWENNGRIDYSVTHPPETMIDLDGEYKGKMDRASKRQLDLKWQFFQSSTLRHKPPNEQSNSTYYAYTEVYFEKETEMLLAVGTDDAAKVWINDLVVWHDDELSPWNMEEGYRKVLFKEGYNRVVIRIENGPAVCHFSVLLCPPDALPPRRN